MPEPNSRSQIAQNPSISLAPLQRDSLNRVMVQGDVLKSVNIITIPLRTVSWAAGEEFAPNRLKIHEFVENPANGDGVAGLVAHDSVNPVN